MYLKIISLLFLLLSSLYANNPTKKVSLQLLWKHQFEFAGFYMAKEKGFYKDLGLDVNFKEYKLNSNIAQDVASGKADFSVGYSGIILDKINGVNIKLLNAIYQSSPHVLVSLKSSGIKSIEDFKGKKISMTNSHTKTANIKSMIYFQNIQLNDMIYAKKAGFEIVRTQHAISPKILESMIPYCEKLDIKLTVEMHHPHNPYVPVWEEYIKLMQNKGGGYLGIVPDFSIFQVKPHKLLIERLISAGFRKEKLDDVLKLHEEGASLEETKTLGLSDREKEFSEDIYEKFNPTPIGDLDILIPSSMRCYS